MSDKFFFKGKKEKKPKHASYGFNTKRAVKAGSEELPAQVTVSCEARAMEIKTLAAKHDLVVEITIDANQTENTLELDVLLNKPSTVRVQKMPARNDPCICASGKKYKKCCGL